LKLKCHEPLSNFAFNFNLRRYIVEPPVLDLYETYSDSTTLAPLIFVLSPGVDPTANLRQLAAAKGLGDRFFSVALGQGQAPVATKLISTATVEGNWAGPFNRASFRSRPYSLYFELFGTFEGYFKPSEG
jgi:hypothetical protein